jgi:hypothetical protein
VIIKKLEAIQNLGSRYLLKYAENMDFKQTGSGPKLTLNGQPHRENFDNDFKWTAKYDFLKKFLGIQQYLPRADILLLL